MFWDASRHQNEAKGDPIWVDLGLILESFFGRGRYAKSEYSSTVLTLFGDLRGPQNGFKSDLKTSILKMIPNCLKMAPEGVDLGGFWVTFWSQFCKSVLSWKMVPFGSYSYQGSKPHRGASKKLLN